MFVRCRLTDRRDPLFSVQTGEADSLNKTKSDTTEWGHAWLHSCTTKTQAHTNVTLQQSAKTSVPHCVCVCVCVCARVCWQRQTVMLLPAA